LRRFAGFDLLGETNFVILRQKRVLTDVGQIQADKVFFVTIDSVFGHLFTLTSSQVLLTCYRPIR
jgi:hypothetical protein